jgi:hypothetical protein
MSRILKRFKRPDIYSVEPNMLDPNTTAHTHTNATAEPLALEWKEQQQELNSSETRCN